MAEDEAEFEAMLFAEGAAQQASSYRVKFKRAEFLELVGIAKPRIIYHRGRMQSPIQQTERRDCMHAF